MWPRFDCRVLSSSVLVVLVSLCHEDHSAVGIREEAYLRLIGPDLSTQGEPSTP